MSNYYQQNMYNQNQNQNQMYPQQGMYQQYNVKKPRKKKHRFLKFLLILLICLIIYNIARYFIKNYAEQVLQNQTEIPFTFSDGDNQQHITKDFDILTSFSNDDKNYSVTWSSNNSAISVDENGHATVSSVPCNKNVILTETYKILSVSANRTYNCIVVTDNEQEYADSDIIDIQSINNGDYGYNAEIAYRSDGSISYIYGDFGEVKIYNEKDAYNFLNIYRDILNIPDELEMSLRSTSSTNDATQYIFSTYYNNILVDCNDVILCISNVDFKPIKIVNNVIENSFENVNNIEIEPSEYYNLLIDYYGTDEFAYTDDGTIIAYGKCYEKLTVYWDACYSETVYIDKENMSVEITDNGSEYVALNKEFDSVDVSGIDEHDNKVNLDGGFDDNYILVDPSRNIVVTKWVGNDNISVKGLLTGDNIIDTNVFGYGASTYITSDTSEFDKEYAVEVETLSSLENAYDFYYNTFGIRSYDNKGSVIRASTNITNVKLFGVADIMNMKTNAAWSNISKRIYIGPGSSIFEYSLVNTPEVLVHEYTHGVFNEKTGSNGLKSIVKAGSMSDGYISAINEAYADVMACLATKSKNWKIGYNKFKPNAEIHGEVIKSEEYTCFRDLSTIEQGEWTTKIFGKFPEYYDDSDFDERDEHSQSLLLGHLGYEMYQSGYWTNKELARIWMHSLMLGYNNQSNFVTVRRNIIQALDDLNYNTECKDFVAYTCDEMHIFDDSYIITTDKYLNGVTGDTQDDLTIVRSEDNSIAGDPIFDDEIMHKYLVAYSPLGVYMKGEKIYIFEAGSNNTGIPDSEMSKLIEDKLNTSSNIKTNMEFADTTKEFVEDVLSIISDSDVKFEESNKHINVEYRHIPNFLIDSYEKILTDGGMDITEYAIKTLNIDENLIDDDTESIFNFTYKLALNYFVINSTAYDLYNTL